MTSSSPGGETNSDQVPDSCKHRAQAAAFLTGDVSCRALRRWRACQPIARLNTFRHRIATWSTGFDRRFACDQAVMAEIAAQPRVRYRSFHGNRIPGRCEWLE